MREKNKKILYSILIIFILIILKNAMVKAATTSLSANTTEPTEGQSVTVTASVNAGAWNLSFSGAGKNETIYGYTQTNANSSDSKSITFTAGSAGTTYTFSLTGDMTDITSNSSEPVNRTITITVKSNASTSNGSSSSENNSNNGGSNSPTTSPKSSNANVKMITTSPVDFSGFKASKTSGYEVTVENDVDKINVSVNKEDSKASVSLLNKTNSDTGKSWVYIAEGNNEIAVTVKSEDGKNQKTYTINVTRKAKEETEEPKQPEQPEENSEEEPMEEAFGLSELKIEGLELKPQFQTDVYEYNVELKEDLEILNIKTLATKANSEIEITGNENLQEGENIITIILKGENEAETVAYQIIVNKTLEKQEVISNSEQEQQEKMKKIIILSAAVGVILIIVIAVIIVKVKKSKNSNGGYIPYENLVDDYDEEDKVEEQPIEDVEEEFYEEEPKRKKRSKGKRFK